MRRAKASMSSNSDFMSRRKPAVSLQEGTGPRKPGAGTTIHAHAVEILSVGDGGNALPDGVLGQFRNAVKPQLGHDVEPVRFHGLRADRKRFGDALRGLALGEKLQHLDLAMCKNLAGGRRRLAE